MVINSKAIFKNEPVSSKMNRVIQQNCNRRSKKKNRVGLHTEWRSKQYSVQRFKVQLLHMAAIQNLQN